MKELYEKPYSMLLQFQTADFITTSEIPDDLVDSDGDGKDAGNQGW